MIIHFSASYRMFSMSIYVCRKVRLERYISATSRVYHVTEGTWQGSFCSLMDKRKTQLLLNVLRQRCFPHRQICTRRTLLRRPDGRDAYCRTAQELQ